MYKIIFICENSSKEHETVHKSSLKQKVQTVPIQDEQNKVLNFKQNYL